MLSTTELNKFILFLKCVDGLSDSTIRKLVLEGKVEDAVFLTQNDILEWLKSKKVLFGKKDVLSSLTKDKLTYAKEKRSLLESELQEKNVRYVSYFDNNYPSRFKRVIHTRDLFQEETVPRDFPVLLFFQGNLSLLNENSIIGFVGTRKPSQKAINYGTRLAMNLVEGCNVITGGLAEGCDTIGHRACVVRGGKTVAFLGSGIDKIYPRGNKNLCDDIVGSGGALVSEYPLGTLVAPYRLVERDRLIALASDAIYVIETKKDGGTIHTVEAAKKYGRDLYVLNPKLVNESEGNQYIVDEYNARIIPDFVLYANG